MPGSSAFFILIPVMYLLFTLALSIIAVVDRNLISARWAVLGFSVAFVSILVDGYRDPAGDPWVSWFTIATHFIPLLIMVQAFLSRHHRHVPRFAIWLAVAGCVYAMPHMPWTPPHWLRAIAVQAICTAIIASGLPTLWSLRKRSMVDRIAFGVILGAALSYAGRTAVVAAHPIGDSREDVLAFYEGLNIVFQSASALMGMSVGIVLMMTIGFDMLRGSIEESEIDPLTGVGNRRRMERVIAESERGRRSIEAVIVVDLDHFKQVNDNYGHDGGDRVLQAVGTCLKSQFAQFGEVFRTGGEEFVILLESESAQAVAQLALSARALIANLSFGDVHAALTVTASVGFHRQQPGETVDAAVRLADQAVYCAKKDGRDRVVGSVSDRGLQIFKAVA